jgi:hypothetical protein
MPTSRSSASYKLLGGHRRLAKNDAEGVDFGIVADAHRMLLLT